MKVSNYCTNTYCRVRNLTVNKEYDFRVYAENHYGVSDPGMNDDGIKVLSIMKPKYSTKIMQ